jgi:hypothetical protein
MANCPRRGLWAEYTAHLSVSIAVAKCSPQWTDASPPSTTLWCRMRANTTMSSKEVVSSTTPSFAHGIMKATITSLAVDDGHDSSMDEL